MTDFPDLTPELERIEARLRARAAVDLRLDNLPALDDRPMEDQLEDGLAQMLRAFRLFEDADDVVDVVGYYALVWTHRYGPAWHESETALAQLGRYEDAHDFDAMTELQHCRAFYQHPSALLEEHLTVAHGFDHAVSWTPARRLAAHANVHHVLPVGAE